MNVLMKINNCNSQQKCFKNIPRKLYTLRKRSPQLYSYQFFFCYTGCWFQRTLKYFIIKSKWIFYVYDLICDTYLLVISFTKSLKTVLKKFSLLFVCVYFSDIFYLYITISEIFFLGFLFSSSVERNFKNYLTEMCKYFL